MPIGPTYSAKKSDASKVEYSRPSKDEQDIIRAMFAVGVAAPSETNIHIYEDRRVALMFIDAHTASYCSKSSETAIRAQLHCAEQQHISLSEVAASQPSKINIRIASSGDDDGCKNTALAKAPNNAKIFGFDVSHHNSNIDWNKLVADGYYFVFIKATQGTNFADPKFKEYWEAAGKAGLIRGAYHYMSKDNAKSQAGFFLTVLKSVVVGPCDIGAAGDFEWELPGDELPIAEKVELAKQWLKEVRAATGKPPVLYVPVPYLRQISDPSDFAGNPLWVAQYTSEPKLPTDRTRYDFWQFSDSHFGPTLSPRYSTQSGMGLNLFNGSKADLFALAK